MNVNGNKIGIIGYTTESADSTDPAVLSAIDVVACDWSSTNSAKIHFADYVNDLRNNQKCNMVILLTHMGHSGLCTTTSANPTPILVTTRAAVLPEIAVTGHWHTSCETLWQPAALNYKTLFTEAGSFTHYIGELHVDSQGKYVSSREPCHSQCRYHARSRRELDARDPEGQLRRRHCRQSQLSAVGPGSGDRLYRRRPASRKVHEVVDQR